MRRFLLSCLAAAMMALNASVAVGVQPATKPARPLTLPFILAIEPSSFNSQFGGVLSVIGRDIVTGTVVRLVDYGALQTEFVNDGVLRALVPAGLNARRYPIELIEPGGAVVSTVFSIDIFNTPATPLPTNPPPTVVPGKPLVALRNFVLDPPKPIVGREFTVTVELYNTGSRAAENTLVTFPGGNFTPVGANNGYLVGQMHINASATLSQRFRVPTNLQSQVYELKFNISANDWSGENFQFPQTVPVEVIGVYPGRPQVVIEGVRTDPPQLRAGQPFTLMLDLANRGSRTAVNTLVSLVPTTDVLPSISSNVLNIDLLGVDRQSVVTLPLVLAANSGSGRRVLDIALDYTDYVGTQAYSAKQNVSINVNDTLTDRPQIVLANYRTEPQTPAPGEVFTLTYSLSNVGGGEARRLTAALGGENGTALKPFAPVNSGNVQFVQTLAAGKSINVVQQLVAEASADSGTFNLPVALAYEDSRDQRRAEQQVMSLLIRRMPLLRVGFNPAVTAAFVGQPMQLSVEVVNIGRKLVNVNVVEVTSEDMDVQNGSLYFGALDAGASSSLPAQGTPRKAGPAELRVVINYVDELNQPQQYIVTLPVEVQDAPVGPPPGETPGGQGPVNPLQDDRPLVVRLLSALFGLGS